MKPRVTIGIPVYNGEKYLRNTIESVLAQTFGDFELIISDNASTDSTASIALKYVAKDERVRYHRNKRNVGAARNHNVLVEMARGEFFKWLASDDVIAPEFLAGTVAALDAEPLAVLAYTRGAGIDEQGAIIKYAQHPVALVEQLDPVKRFRLFRERSGFSAWPMLYIFALMRTEVLRSTRLQGSFMGSDNSVIYEMLFRGLFVEVPQPLCFFRQHAGSFSTFANDNKARAKFFNGHGGRLNALVGYKRLYLEYVIDLWRAPLGPVHKLGLLWANLRWAITERKTSVPPEESMLVPTSRPRPATGSPAA